jgi:hypothetical protein
VAHDDTQKFVDQHKPIITAFNKDLADTRRLATRYNITNAERRRGGHIQTVRTHDLLEGSYTFGCGAYQQLASLEAKCVEDSSTLRATVRSSGFQERAQSCLQRDLCRVQNLLVVALSVVENLLVQSFAVQE